MAQRSVEIVLGKLLCDDRFRHDFLLKPQDTCRQHGLVLTPVELEALRRLRKPALDAAARAIDPRIRVAGTNGVYPLRAMRPTLRRDARPIARGLLGVAIMLLFAGTASAACRGTPNNHADPGEQCDGGDLRGLTCGNFCGQITQQGSGLSCNPDCTLNVSGCATCGNNRIEGRELCDGSALGSGSCLRGGNVTCLASCGGWNFNACYACGNGSREGTEECDGTQLGGATCPVGSTSGAPRCGPDCRVDYTPCVRCGDGDLDPGELCDDGNTLNGDGCSSTCQDECGDGTIEAPQEACDDGGRTAGDGCSAFCGWERIYAGGGTEQADVCALEWGAASSTIGPTLHCRDGQSPCDRGPSGDSSCRFQLYFCVNNPLFSGSCTWNGVAQVELIGPSLSGSTQLTAADQTTVLGAFETMLSRWGGAAVSGSDPVRIATPPVEAEVCGQFRLDVARNTTKAVAVRISDDAGNVDVDQIDLTCDL